ncbi:MAG: methyl-accepting chemotaxis protein [Sphingomonas sp.]
MFVGISAMQAAMVFLGTNDIGQRGAALGGVVATLVVILVSKKLICDPYVNTVVRMESLAAGNLDGPINYTEHTDCVGRLTKAMTVFRDNALEMQKSDVVLKIVVPEVTTALGRLKDGDLTYRIQTRFGDGHDMLRTNFNDTMDELQDVLARVSDAAGHVHGGASEIRAASDDLSMRTEQQAARLEESAAAMRDVTSMVEATAQNAATVGAQIADTNVAATEGGAVVRRAIDAMGQIEKSSQEITQIINVIDGIAFQTNLLALNAGVEAARAGDAGKGFAVVANEVRALAQRSADAAKDIKALITSSSAGVTQGAALVSETGTMLGQIVSRVSEINGRIAEISSSAQAQAEQLVQLNASVGEMDKMTQQNAAMVEESTAAARSLADEANSLAALVQRFQTGVVKAPVATDTPAPQRRKPAARPVRKAAPTEGNAALKIVDEDDWAEF